MGVRFVIGRAGTGKTRRCFARIVELIRQDPWGTPILWIVPKQATFQAERSLTIALGAYARARILSFENFGRAVLDECGGAARPDVSARGRQMILGWLLPQMTDQLQFFGGVARQPGLIGKLDAAFVEMERCGKTPSDLEPTSDKSPDALSQKISDLKKIYARYLDFLGQDRLDPHRRLQEVLLRMEGCSLLADSYIFIDGFLDYRQYERQMIAGMARHCAEMEITVLADPAAKIFSDPHHLPGQSDLFHRTENAYRQLYFTLQGQNIAIDPPVCLKTTTRFQSAGLAAIEREFFIHDRLQPETGVSFFQCDDRRAEAMAAAAQAASFLGTGLRCRDILILCRDIGDYADLLKAAFIEHGIPFFLDCRRTVAHHPLLQLLRSLLVLLRQHWPHEAMMSIIKTGLVGLSAEQADELENYVLLHRIRGEKTWTDKNDWTYRSLQLTRDDEKDAPSEEQTAARSVDGLRRTAFSVIADFARQMNNPTDAVQQRVAHLFGLLERLQVRGELEKWMHAAERSGDPEQKSEHTQVWNRLVDLFDEMVQLLGSQSCSLDLFAEILEAGLDSFDLALTPPTVDQVLIGQVDRTRTGQHRAVILVGLNEGQFPLIATEDSILSDRERAELKNRQLEFEADSQQQRMNENLLAYIAMTRSSEHLILLRATTDNAGRPTTPSIYWRMFQNAESHHFGPGVEDITTCTQAVSRLLKWVRNGAKPSAIPEGVYEWLRQTAPATAAGKLRGQTWTALTYDNAALLNEATAHQLFRHPLVASVSQLETFAACPFKHFLRYGLQLELREETDPTPMDLGNLYHEALRKIVTNTLREKLEWAELSEQKAQELVWQSTEEVGQELREELMISSARNQHLLGWVGRTLEKITAALRAATRLGQFRPALAEMAFGVGAKMPPLVLNTEKGNRLELRGKIDRIDLHQSGRAFSIVDYKTSSRTLELDHVWHGLSLQLLIYMMVVQEHGEKIWGTKAEAAAGLYVELLRKLESVDNPEDCMNPDDPCFDLRVKPRGIVRDNFVMAFDKNLEPGTESKVLSAKMNLDGAISKSSSDVISKPELEALLGYVRKKVAELADRILEGYVRANPYRLGEETPCRVCDYHSICRFQPAADKYLHISHIKRDVIFERLMNGDES